MKRFITGGILAMGLILPMQATAWSGSIFGGIDPTETDDSGAIYGSSGTDSHTIVRPPHVRPPSNTGTIVAALTDAGGTGASGVCCSDLPAQHSEVLIASERRTNPPTFGGGEDSDGGGIGGYHDDTSSTGYRDAEGREISADYSYGGFGHSDRNGDGSVSAAEDLGFDI
jgi:hypothetical protein